MGTPFLGKWIHRRQVYRNDPTDTTVGNRQDHETRETRELRSASFELERETSATRPANPVKISGQNFHLAGGRKAISR